MGWPDGVEQGMICQENRYGFVSSGMKSAVTKKSHHTNNFLSFVDQAALQNRQRFLDRI